MTNPFSTQPQAPQQYAPAPQQQYQQAAPAVPQQQAAPAFTPTPTFVAAPNTSAFPRQEDLRGRLLLITPTSTTQVASQTNPGTMFTAVDCDVVVLDGGPVVSAKDGKVFQGHAFKGIGLSGQRVANQLSTLVGTGKMVLGRINTQKGSGAPAKGNAWGIETQFTDADAELATRYLNGDRSFVVPADQPAQQAPQAPAQQYAPAPQQQQYAPQAPAQQYAQAPQPQYTAPPAAPSGPWAGGGQPLAGPNPFAQQ